MLYHVSMYSETSGSICHVLKMMLLMVSKKKNPFILRDWDRKFVPKSQIMSSIRMPVDTI